MVRTDYFDFPYHIDGRGRTAETGEDDHIRDLIYQVLFTNPGERVNRPDFGCGISQLVFMPNIDDVIAVQRVECISQDNALTVAIVFTKRSTGEERAETFLSPWRV